MVAALTNGTSYSSYIIFSRPLQVNARGTAKSLSIGAIRPPLGS
jgi:hypothetical protein